MCMCVCVCMTSKNYHRIFFSILHNFLSFFCTTLKVDKKGYVQDIIHQALKTISQNKIIKMRSSITEAEEKMERIALSRLWQ